MMGWICPRCAKVHAPSVLACQCKPPEAKFGGQYQVNVPNKLYDFGSQQQNYWRCPDCGIREGQTCSRQDCKMRRIS